MSAVELITELGRRGVRLSLEGEQLRVRAPQGALTPELRARLAQHKSEVVDFIRQAQRATRAAAAPALTPRPRPPEIPLSFAQERLWFLDRWAPGSAAYNVFYGIELEGPAQPEALERSLAEILRRHEVLRTTYGERAGRPYQRIAATASPALPVVDLGALAEERRRDQALGLLEAEVRRPFDLAAGPVLRTLLLRSAPRRHTLLLDLHHIAADGWSTGVLVEELLALYQAFAAGWPSPLPELPLQYADFALWQREWLRGEVFETEMAYWRERLAALPDALELPADRPRPPQQSFRGRSLVFRLPADLSARVRRRAQELGVTPYAYTLAAWKALLLRYGAGTDLVVGSPTANRNRTELEGLIGFFVNTLVLRTEVLPELSFRQLVERVRETTLGAQAHQNVPFERLVEELAPGRDPSRSPLFQLLFVFQNAPRPAVEMAGLRLAPVVLDNATAKFDLSLTLLDTEPAFEGELEVATDLWDVTTARRMLGHFEGLLASATSAPDTALSELALLTPAQRHQLLVEWNETPRPAPLEALGLDELVSATAARLPGAAAVRLGDQELSYFELEARAGALARRLAAGGVGLDARVGVFLGRSLALPVAVLGALKAGAAYVPLDPRYPPERLRFMIADADLALVLTDGAHRAALEELVEGPLPILEVDAEGRVEASGSASESAAVSVAEDLARDLGAGRVRDPASLAYVIYTSGSTGRPKGVAMPHAPLLNLFRWQLGRSPAGGGTTLQFAALSFDVSCQEMFCTWAAGGTLLLVPDELPRDPEALLDLLAAERVGRLFLPFVALENLARVATAGPGASEEGECERPRPPLSEVITAGEQLRMTPALVSWLESLGHCRLVNQYGPSETHVVSFWDWPPERPAHSAPALPPIGRPVDGVRLYVLDGAGRPRPPGVPGELCLGGEGPARGYLRRPGVTAQRFGPDPFSPLPGARLYRTGDLARWRADGDIDFLGRVDHQVKIRGYRVELGEVEAALARRSGIRQALCTARPTAGGAGGSSSDLRLVAYLVPEEGSKPDLSTLRRDLAAEMPDFMVPAVFVLLDRLPLTPSGKVDRRALPDPGGEGRGEGRGGGGRVEPRSATEEVLAGIWAQLLERDGVGVHDDFFALGGHSLLATQVMARVGETFEVDLPIRTLFERPTVAGLAERVTAALAEGRRWSMPPLEALAGVEELPLSYPQEAMWLFEQLVPGTAAYATCRAGRLRGDLDAAALEAAWEEMVGRHEILRTTYHTTGSDGLGKGPVQRIHPRRRLPLPVVDLQGLEAERRETEALELSNRQARTAFDLERGPVGRASLLRLGPDDNVFLLALHHIAYDLWSGGILLGELEQLYLAFAAGPPSSRPASPLPRLPLRYADFAAWQRRWLQGEVLEGQLDYWRRQLEGVTEAPARLPTDRPRPAVEAHRGDSRYLRLPRSLSDAVLGLGRGQGCTEYMTLLAVFVTFLHRYGGLHRSGGARDVVVGSFITNRNRVELEGLLGFFDNTVVLRTDAGGDPTFSELLDRVREVALGAYAHQYLPFEMLVEELQPDRSTSPTPLFQAAFIHMLNYPAMERRVAGLEMVPFALESRSAKFDFSLALRDAPAGIAGEIEYDADLFDATTIERMARHLRRLMAAVVEGPGRRLSELPMLDAAEVHQLRHEWNDVGAPVPATTVQALVAEQARRRPEAAAVVDGSGVLGYGELWHRARGWAAALRRLGVGPGSVVGVLAGRSAEMITALLAVLEAGAAYLPLDPGLPAERLGFVLEDSGARLVLADAASAPLLEGSGVFEGSGVPIKRLGELPGAPPADVPAPPGVGAEDLAYVIYTSGSTGRPKGVAVPHGGLINLVAWYRESFAPAPGDRVAVVAGLGFDVAVSEIWPNLAAGACLVLPADETRRDPEALLGWLADEGVDLAFAPTPLGEALLRLEPPPALTLRALMVAGDRLHRAGPAGLPYELYNLYGPTESTVYATGCRVEPAPGATPGTPHDSLPPSIGRPVRNTRAVVAGDRLELLPPGVVGELWLSGRGLARGYLGRPGLTADRFRPDPWSGEAGARVYRTGDRARLGADGRIAFLGRLDYQVKIRGYRIELGEIEAALQAHPAVVEAVVVAPEDAAGERTLVAYMVLAEDMVLMGNTVLADAVVEEELRAHLRRGLPDYMVPAIFEVLDALPRSASGKIDRRALPAPRSLQTTPRTGAVPPRDDVELELLKLWRELPGFAGSGVTDDFLDLGGHSMLALRFAARVEEVLGRRLPMAEIFRRPTVAELAAQLRSGSREPALEGQVIGPAKGAGWSSVLVELASGEGTPLFCVHPVGGSVFCYAPLADALGRRRPFYGLQAPSNETRAETLAAGGVLVEDLARLYTEAIRELQPTGPYYLAGWSMGGVVAYEMARRLEADGEEVALLAIFDADARMELDPPAEGAAERPSRAVLVAEFARDLSGGEAGLDAAQLEGESEAGQNALALAWARRRGIVPPDLPEAWFEEHFNTFLANLQALYTYRPQSWAGRIDLFRPLDPSSAEPAGGWDALAGEVEVWRPGGDHYSMLRPPHVAGLAQRLLEALERSEARSGQQVAAAARDGADG